MALVWLALLFAATSHAQSGPCVPMSPPSWINITNIQSTSALASWGAVFPGAWYQVELKNMNTGLVVDLAITQATSRTYTGLLPGTHYRVTVKASSCNAGPFGAGNSADFHTPTIIIDDIVNLDMGQQAPDQQSGFLTADHLIMQSQFTICIYKVGMLPPANPLDEVFHAYIKLANGHFFEFLMFATLDNLVYQSFSPLRVPNTDWQVQYFDENGNQILVAPQGSKVATLKVRHLESNQWVEKMAISSINMKSQQTVMPLAVTLQNGVEFYHSVNESNICSPSNVNFQAPGGGSSVLTSTHAEGSVKPNPFGDYLHLDVPGFESTPSVVRIFDFSGRLQFEFINTGTGESIPRIITGDWQPGVYYLHIQTETGSSVQPIVKI